MTPDYGRGRRSTNIGNLTVKITVDASGVDAQIKKLESSLVQMRIKEKLEKIDDLKQGQKEIMNSKQISSIVRGWMGCRIEEEIQEIKEQIKLLIERY